MGDVVSVPTAVVAEKLRQWTCREWVRVKLLEHPDVWIDDRAVRTAESIEN